MSKGSGRRPTNIKEQEDSLRWELICSTTSNERKDEILIILRSLTNDRYNK